MLFSQESQLDVLDSMIYNLIKDTPPDIINAVHELVIRIENDHPLAYQKRKSDRERDLKIVSWANHFHKAGVIANEIMGLYEYTNQFHKENTPYTVNEFVTTYRNLKNEEQLNQENVRSREISDRIKNEKDCSCLEGWILTKKIDNDYKFFKNHIIKVATPCTKCYLGQSKLNALNKPKDEERLVSQNNNNNNYKSKYPNKNNFQKKNNYYNYNKSSQRQTDEADGYDN